MKRILHGLYRLSLLFYNDEDDRWCAALLLIKARNSLLVAFKFYRMVPLLTSLNLVPQSIIILTMLLFSFILLILCNFIPAKASIAALNLCVFFMSLFDFEFMQFDSQMTN